MDKQVDIIDAITKKGLLPLYFRPSESHSINVLRALYKSGVRAVEYTNRGKEAFSNFKAMKRTCEDEMKDMYLGIGTIKNKEAASVFIEAGADFMISPGLAEDIAAVAQKANILWMPGCMTPSEIMKAESWGVKMVKLFPGNVLTPAFVSAVKEVFPGILFMPTGGVDTTTENLSAWFAAGVCAVGMGSKLLPKTMVEVNDDKAIIETTSQILKAIESIR